MSKQRSFGNAFNLKGHSRFIRKIIQLGSIAIIFFLLKSCYYSYDAKKNQKPPIPVVAIPIEKKDFPLFLNTIGTVTALKSVTVKTQINGHITKLLFKEGDLVKQGQEIIHIDPRPYEAALKQSEGQLLKDQALLENARLDLKRYKKLFKEDAVSQQTLDTQIYLVKQLEGTVKADSGLVEAARVNLDYCKIQSNIDGVIGLQQVTEGNYVQSSDTTPLTLINQLDPIAVVFSIPEDDLIQVYEQYQLEKNLPVEIFDRSGEKKLAIGTLIAFDSQINTATGTINLKAMFDNKDRKLFPNQFVNIRLKLKTLKDSLVIPSAALQTGRNGIFLYIVNPKDHKVRTQLITIKSSVDELTAITGEIKPGDLVVSQGQDKLTTGTVVKIAEGKKASK